MRRETLALVLLLAASPVGAEPRFEPVTVDVHVYDGGWEHFVGGGLAVFDCDGDHRPDMVAAGGTQPLRLFRNVSADAIAFRSEDLGFSKATGAYPIDLEGDGDPDLVILRAGPDLFLANDGTCGFTELSLPGITFADQWTTAFSATWEEGRSRPTLAFGHYVDRADPKGPFEACDSNTLWRPEGDTYTSTILEPGHCTLSALFTDWDRTGRADLRLSNDRHYYVSDGEEQLWAMEPVPRLFARADGWNAHKLWGMGIAARDLDRDGTDEVFLSSMGDQRLMRREGPGAGFVDVPFSQGTTAHRPYTGDDGRPSTGWHIAFGDIQNNGRDDVFIAKGNVQQMPDAAMQDPNNLLIQQEDGTFREFGDSAGVGTPERSRGAALVDLDGDGRLDLAVVNRRAPLEVFRNVSEGTGAWLAADLRMPGGNRNAIGAWIEVETRDGVQSREVTIGGGHAGGMLVSQHFGLGAADKVRMRVKWPHGAWSDWVPIAVNRRLRVEPDGAVLSVSAY